MSWHIARNIEKNISVSTEGRFTLPVFVILDNIRSLWNVGAIFRTSDGAGVERIFLCGITAIPPRAEISKTALGAENYVKWEYYSSTVYAIETLRKRIPSIKIVALEQTNSSKCYYKYNFSFPLALVIGHEGLGVSPEVLDIVDDYIEIPMLGFKESLNVAISYGIAIYQVLNYYLTNFTSLPFGDHASCKKYNRLSS